MPRSSEIVVRVTRLDASDRWDYRITWPCKMSNLPHPQLAKAELLRPALAAFQDDVYDAVHALIAGEDPEVPFRGQGSITQRTAERLLFAIDKARSEEVPTEPVPVQVSTLWAELDRAKHVVLTVIIEAVQRLQKQGLSSRDLPALCKLLSTIVDKMRVCVKTGLIKMVRVRTLEREPLHREAAKPETVDPGGLMLPELLNRDDALEKDRARNAATKRAIKKLDKLQAEIEAQRDLDSKGDSEE